MQHPELPFWWAGVFFRDEALAELHADRQWQKLLAAVQKRHLWQAVQLPEMPLWRVWLCGENWLVVCYLRAAFVFACVFTSVLCKCQCFPLCVCVYIFVFLPLCVRGRERGVCVCIWERECMCGCMCERECAWMCWGESVCERERARVSDFACLCRNPPHVLFEQGHHNGSCLKLVQNLLREWTALVTQTAPEYNFMCLN